MKKRIVLGRAPTSGLMAITFIVAIALDMLPWGKWLLPNFVALILVFWNVFQPRRVGVALAWLLGIITDVHQGSLLGQHALAYSILSYGAIALHRRLLWYSLKGQALQLFPLFFLANLSVMLVSLFFSGITPSWTYLVAPMLTAACWIPWTNWMLSYLNRTQSSMAAIGR
jgi:rod shape-determining protein MreD